MTAAPGANENTAASGSALLAASGLSVVFAHAEAPVKALTDFAIDINAGEMVGLMGEPGSGKSTAAFALTGLARSTARIVAGQVHYRGRDILRLPEQQQRQLRGSRIALITQNPRASLHPMLNVGTQLVNVYRAHHAASGRAALSAAADLLRRVGINDPQRRLSAYPHELSTGMAQRVVIAIALAGEPELLIADEPTSGLDVTIQAQLLDQLWDAAQATGSSVLLVTQDLGIVANYCDRVFVMQAGTVVESQSVAKFFQMPAHPYSQKILALQRTDPNATDTGAAPPADAVDVVDRPVLLAVKALRKTFPLPHSRKVIQAVDHVSLELRRGETFGLVGESGSGKTTVGRTILHLEKPSGGAIFFQGKALHEMSESQLRPLRARLQIVFQDPMDAMDPRWNIEQIISEPLRLTDLAAVDRSARIDELLTAVGLPLTLRSQKPGSLSAGQQQRIGIARAMATKPDFIVLDEPTSALTPETTVEILKLLRRLQIEFGVSYLFISHDLATVRFLCHRIAVLYLGQVVETGNKDQVFAAPRHPYTRALLASHLYPDLQNRRVDSPQRETLVGDVPSPVDLPAGCYLYGRCPVQQARCRSEPQELAPLADGRAARCWRVLEGEI
jgi:oligopeptide/dipeptide ABC transporter ATP-binding protein